MAQASPSEGKGESPFLGPRLEARLMIHQRWEQQTAPDMPPRPLAVGHDPVAQEARAVPEPVARPIGPAGSQPACDGRNPFWLIIPNFTVVWFLGWSWSFSLKFIEAGVIHAIGVCMVTLAGIIWLPRWAMAAFALGQILGHNLLDRVKPEQFGNCDWFWKVLHVKGGFEFGATRIDLYYPIIPWIGVMTLGYLFGSMMLTPHEIRRRRLWQMGLGALALFFLLRYTNSYGDLHRWSAQATRLRTTFSFFSVQKHPPSLDLLHGS